jgi:hypothetical protein
VKGEIFLEIKNAINALIDQLSTFVAEVTCGGPLKYELRTILLVKARVKDVAGTWQHLTGGVHTMDAN